MRKTIFMKVMCLGLNTNFNNFVGKAACKFVGMSRKESGKQMVYFYNEKFNNRCTLLTNPLPFQRMTPNVAPIHSLTAETQPGLINVRGVLKWIGEEEDGNNSRLRNAVIADASGKMPLCVWRTPVIASLVDGST